LSAFSNHIMRSKGICPSGVSVMPVRRRGDAGAVRVEPQRPARATDVLLPELQTDQERFRLATEALVGFLYDFSPAGSTSEVEELTIIPDQGRAQAHASLAEWRLA
jgi:hypothetical protein